MAFPESYLFPDSRNSHHPSGCAFFCAMREEAPCAARRAMAKCCDVTFQHSGRKQLTAVGFREVQMELRSPVAMSGSAHVHKQQRIFLTHWIGSKNLVKQQLAIFELRFELVFEFLAHFIAALLDTRPDRGSDIFRHGAIFAAHDSETLLDDALDRAAPSGMKHPDGFVSRIRQDDWKTIGSLNGQHEPGHAGDQPIAGKLAGITGFHNMNDVGMNLPKRNQRPFRCTQAAQECLSIIFNRRAGVFFGEAQVQRFLFAIHAGKSTCAGAEAMNEPRNLPERSSLQDLNSSRGPIYL